MKLMTSLAALVASVSLCQAADISGGVVKIGVLNDQSGVYADFGGKFSYEAARMAVEDYGGAVGLDCETTGLDVRRDQILSIGAIKLKGDTILTSQRLDFLVRPKQPVSERTILIHHIRPIDIADAVPLAEALEGAEASGRRCLLRPGAQNPLFGRVQPLFPVALLGLNSPFRGSNG